MIKKIFLLTAGFLYGSFVLSAEETNKNTVIINNEAAATAEQEVISAPALIPSDAKKLRDARERQEIKTEGAIIKELERQRLLDEQKRLDELLGEGPQPVPAFSPTEPVVKQWFLENKAFLSVGPGFVTYPGANNVNSMHTPAIFVGFGGYNDEGNVIFDLSLYYSEHYLEECVNNCLQRKRSIMHQPGLSMSVKYSPLAGKAKPYIGASGSVIFRKISDYKPEGDIDKYISYELTRAHKQWYQSYDAGAGGGVDVVLGKKLGLNVDARYHVNLYTGHPPAVTAFGKHYKRELEKRDSLILSANLRYYF